MTRTLHEVVSMLREDHEDLGSWAEVGHKYGLSKGAVYGIAKQRLEPHDMRIRRALGMGQRVCDHCHRKLAPPRKALPRATLSPEAGWWRNDLTSAERKMVIRFAYKHKSRMEVFLEKR
jgi:hypothetical protein